MDAKTYWKKLRSVGWLDHVPEEQHAELRGQLEANLASDDSSCVHAALAHTAFEGRDDPPEEILRGLAKCSHGHFTPKNIVCDSTTVSFKHGGKQYSTAVPDTGEWPGTDMIDLSNQALADSDILQRFFELPDLPDCVCVVFVPTITYKKAQDANLIPSRYRVDFCLVRRAESAKVAGLKKMPARLEPVYFWDTTMELLVTLLQMTSGKTKIGLNTIFKDPSLRKTVFELPSDVIEGMAHLPEQSIAEIAMQWSEMAGLGKAYPGDIETDMFSDRIYRICELAKGVSGSEITILVFLKGK